MQQGFKISVKGNNEYAKIEIHGDLTASSESEMSYVRENGCPGLLFRRGIGSDK